MNQPRPVPGFRDDEELRVWMGLPDTPESRAVIAGLHVNKRVVLGVMRKVELELQAGGRPAGVFVRRPRGRR